MPHNDTMAGIDASASLPTVLFLPGLLCDASVFADQRAALAGRMQTAVADFSRHDDLTSMAHAALALCDGPLTVIGHSMGGRVAMEIWRIAPWRVQRLCLMDTGTYPRRDGEEAQRQILVDLAFTQGMAALADRWLPPMVHQERVGDCTLMAPLREMVMRATPELHARQIRALLNRPDARPVLATIRCPTLVMVGRQDRWSPLAQHVEIAGAIAGAELVIIEDSGHMTPVEQPEQVTQALLHWLGLAESPAAVAVTVRLG